MRKKWLMGTKHCTVSFCLKKIMVVSMPDILERRTRLREVGLTTLRELETERGILASGRSEIYGCIFGRDSLITSLKLLKAYRKTGDPYFLAVVKKVLLNLIALQGKAVNIESGEEPGKCIHEYRPDNHEHLTKNAVNPWYVYPDNVMRNYDTVDATPLLLIVTHEYWRASGDEEFLQNALPAVHAALDWIFNYGDGNGDGFIDYRFDPQRKYGGLVTQSWMDSAESLFHDDGAAVPYPVAPVEVQAYTYVALRAWGAYFAGRVPERAAQLDTHAADLKRRFNERFIVQSERGTSLAFALDGNGRPLTAARSSMGHCLWAVWNDGAGGLASILEAQYIPAIVERLLMPDLFEPLAGIRTL
ncbi:MAG: hypothetical protein NUV34_07385, partial [Sulfuricaulis sp.]|nr:hypothetical protein [Sulfuricaulis sp.]